MLTLFSVTENYLYLRTSNSSMVRQLTEKELRNLEEKQRQTEQEGVDM